MKLFLKITYTAFLIRVFSFFIVFMENLKK